MGILDPYMQMTPGALWMGGQKSKTQLLLEKADAQLKKNKQTLAKPIVPMTGYDATAQKVLPPQVQFPDRFSQLWDQHWSQGGQGLPQQAPPSTGYAFGSPGAGIETAQQPLLQAGPAETPNISSTENIPAWA